MLACECPKCGTPVGFDKEAFELAYELDGMQYGQPSKCPDCGNEFRLTVKAEKMVPANPYLRQPPAPVSNLAPCGACGRPISKRATTCPHCGHTGEPESPFAAIGRIIFVILLFLLIGWIISLFD